MSYLSSPKGRIRKRRNDPQPENHQQNQLQETHIQQWRSNIHSSGSKVSGLNGLKKLKLMPIKSSLFKGEQSKGKNSLESKRAKTHLGNEVQRMKGDISKIRHEIMAQRSKIHSLGHLAPSRQIEPLTESSAVEHKPQLFKPFWNQARSLHDSNKRSGALMTSSFIMQQQSNESMTSQSEEEEAEEKSSLFFPIIERGRPKQTRKRENPSQQQPQRLRQYFQMYRSQKNARARMNLLNFRKVAHVVLFTIYLRKYNARMRDFRKMNFEKYVAGQLKEKLLQLKEIIIQHSKPFFNALMQQYNFDLYPSPKDDTKLRKEKLKYMKKILNIQLQCLKETSLRIVTSNENFGQLLYYLCKHGSFSCFHCIYTAEEMNLMSVSQLHGYVSADRWLQKTALISLFLVKLVLYNVLFDAPMLANIFSHKNNDILIRNVQATGNLLYELFIDIQDDLMQRVSPLYVVGNWSELKHRFDFQLAQNMTVKQGFYQKGELVSGLQDHNTIKELFGIKQMVNEKQTISQIVDQLHSMIRKHHEKVRVKCFFR